LISYKQLNLFCKLLEVKLTASFTTVKLKC